MPVRFMLKRDTFYENQFTHYSKSGEYYSEIIIYYSHYPL